MFTRLSLLPNQAATMLTKHFKTQTQDTSKLNKRLVDAILNHKPSSHIINLIESGANPDFRIEREKLPADRQCLMVYEDMPVLLLSLLANNTDATKTLINNNADVNASNAGGLSPLIYTAKNNMYFTAITLLNNGADKHHTDKAGKTARDYAEEKDSQAIVDLLDAHKSKLSALEPGV